MKACFNGVESSPSEAFTISLVNVSVRVSGAGRVEGDGFYEDGDYVTLTAIPSPGEYFMGWRENGVTVSENLEYRFYAYESRQLEARFTGVGVEENAELELEVYPNPVLSQIHVKSHSVIRKMEIISLNGEVVSAMDVNAFTLDYPVEGYAKGMYYLRLSTDEGVVVKQLILSE